MQGIGIWGSMLMGPNKGPFRLFKGWSLGFNYFDVEVLALD
jgi:hypothetical protein